MMRRSRSTAGVPECPADPLPGSGPHGVLIGRENAAHGRSFYCPHADHAGRPASHPLGAAPASRPFFGVDEVSG